MGSVITDMGFSGDEDWGFVCLPSSALDNGWRMWTIGTGHDIFSTTYVREEVTGS